ncbi:CBS domain-containing protein [Bacillus sp. B-jedd]|uniref:CBS domain-containing protein n=1 Tax=Bacillus sp. B-jedd TaxID=1476857 RepID=UPI0005156169|nr:CBS domain-containing protein [Bacillus sp. B-jedd]CEG26697.1 CBS domain-containing protein [Bacillus sp. B-jedd]
MEKVGDFMTENVETCSLLDNMFEVAVKMQEWNVGAIPIMDGERLAGIITDRDIVIRGTAEKKPGSTKVEEIMTKELVTVSPDSSTDEAVKLMAKHQIRRLPVVENSKLLGMVSLGDFAVRERTDEQAGSALSEISETNYNGVQH